MAIATETVEVNGTQFTRTYSTEGRYVVRDGTSYSEAVDPIGSGREYAEGEIMDVDDSKFNPNEQETGGSGTEDDPYVFVPGKACVLNAYYTSSKKYVYMPADAVAHAYGSWDEAAEDMAAWD